MNCITFGVGSPKPFSQSLILSTLDEESLIPRKRDKLCQHLATHVFVASTCLSFQHTYCSFSSHIVTKWRPDDLCIPESLFKHTHYTLKAKQPAKRGLFEVHPYLAAPHSSALSLTDSPHSTSKSRAALSVKRCNVIAWKFQLRCQLPEGDLRQPVQGATYGQTQWQRGPRLVYLTKPMLCMHASFLPWFLIESSPHQRITHLISRGKELGSCLSPIWKLTHQRAARLNHLLGQLYILLRCDRLQAMRQDSHSFAGTIESCFMSYRITSIC